MNLISATVGAAMMGVLLPGVMTMSLAPTVAAVRSNNFATAEALAVTFAAQANNSYELPDVPSGCTVNNAQTEITCTKGDLKYKMAAKRSFLLLDAGASGGLGVYTDLDEDGFDDVTGLFTHYAECYSGWKGQGSLKNNCDLGGKYVIPAYAHLYNDSQESSSRTFTFDTPDSYLSYQCPSDDPWGVQYKNQFYQETYGWTKGCIPLALWNKSSYLASNPDDWLWDISGYGFGQHPDY